MNNNHLIKLTGIAALTLFVAGAMFFVQNKLNTVTTTNSSIPSTLKKFCDCELLTDTTIINSSTGVSRPRIPKSAKQFPELLQYLSPTTTQEVMTTMDQQEAYLMQYPEQTLTALYTAPSSRTIKNVLWSPDEQNVIMELIDPSATTTDGTEGVTVSIISVNLATKETKNALDVAAKLPESKNGFSLFWASDNLQHLVYVIGNMMDGVTWYRSDNGKVSEIKQNISGAIYMKIAVSTAADNQKQSQLLWLDEQGLHSYQLDSGTATDYSITTWSDSPISPPSPDGNYIIYLRRNSNNEAGQFVRLDLRDKSELLLANDMRTDTSGLAQSVWSPDGTRMLVSSFDPESPTVVVNTKELSTVETISYPEMDVLNNAIRAAIPK